MRRLMLKTASDDEDIVEEVSPLWSSITRGAFDLLLACEDDAKRKVFIAISAVEAEDDIGDWNDPVVYFLEDDREA